MISVAYPSNVGSLVPVDGLQVSLPELRRLPEPENNHSIDKKNLIQVSTAMYHSFKFI